jgi:hypothetical protein
MLVLSNRDIGRLKRALKHGPKLTRTERGEYLKQLIRKLSQERICSTTSSAASTGQ